MYVDYVSMYVIKMPKGSTYRDPFCTINIFVFGAFNSLNAGLLPVLLK